MDKRLNWNFIILLSFIFNFHGLVECSVCETCICSGTASARVANCRGKRLEGRSVLNFDLLMFDEEPKLSNLDLAENEMFVLPSDMFRNLVNLKTLDLSENNIQEIPIDAFNYLESLIELDLSVNNLTNFSETIISKVANLERLNLRKNQLSELDPSIKVMTNLTWLDVSYNNLSALTNESFKTLTKLKHLDLSFNRISFIGVDTLIHLTQLTSLNLNNNHLVYLSSRELPTSITSLKVGYNMITVVPNWLMNLRSLEIESNEISEFNADEISFTQIESLNFSGNKLKDFPAVKLAKLDTLDLSFNQLSVVPETLKTETLPELSTLVISGNPIRNLKFDSELKLKWLIARSMDLLERVDEGAFTKLAGHTPQDCLNFTISQNKRLTVVHENAFVGVNMCSLDLSGNNLSSVSPALIKSKNDSAYGNIVVNLQNNPFHCDCSLQWILVDLVPTLYKVHPELLDELKCASPPDLKDMRMVHWYKWRDQVFCEESKVLVSKLGFQAAGVMSGSTESVRIESSTGMLAALIGAAVVLAMLVTVGIVLARRIAVRRSRRNRRF